MASFLFKILTANRRNLRNLWIHTLILANSCIALKKTCDFFCVTFFFRIFAPTIMEYEVTIGIPLYNGEKYIRLAMDSALAQTFESIEFLVLDDCGTDASIDIVRDYQLTHPRGSHIRILHQPCNKGIGAARNRMIAEARGRYFFSLDADDSLAPDAIRILWEAACRHNAELVYGSYERVFTDNQGKVVERVPSIYSEHVFTEPDSYACYAYDKGVQGMNWNYLVLIDVIRRNNLQIAEVGYGYGEDFTFTIDLPTYVTRVVLLPQVTYYYYIHGVDKHHGWQHLKHEHFARAVAAVDAKKRRDELRSKPYYAQRMYRLMLIQCSFACKMVERRDYFDIPFTPDEIRRVMWHPMTLGDILRSKAGGRWKNLFYYVLGVVPSRMTVWMLGMMNRHYGSV